MQLRKPVPLKDIRNAKIASIIEKATSKKQSNRYQSVAEFRAALDLLPHPTGPDPKTGSLIFWIVATLLGLAVGIVFGLLF